MWDKIGENCPIYGTAKYSVLIQFVNGVTQLFLLVTV